MHTNENQGQRFVGLFRSLAKKAGITSCPFSKIVQMNQSDREKILAGGTDLDRQTIESAVNFHHANGYRLWLTEIQRLIDSGFMFSRPYPDGVSENDRLSQATQDVMIFFFFSAWAFFEKVTGGVEEGISNNDLWERFRASKGNTADMVVHYQTANGFEPPVKMIMTALCSLKEQRPHFKKVDALDDLKQDWILMAYNSSNGLSFPGFAGAQYEPLGFNKKTFIFVDGKFSINIDCFAETERRVERNIRIGCVPFYAKCTHKGKSTNVGAAFIDILNNLLVDFVFKD